MTLMVTLNAGRAVNFRVHNYQREGSTLVSLPLHRAETIIRTLKRGLNTLYSAPDQIDPQTTEIPGNRGEV